MIVNLQGLDIHNREELHDILAKELVLPAYYGKNLDALWDVLTGWVDMPLTIVWHNFQVSQQELGEYADRTLNLLRDAEKKLSGFKVELK